MLVGHYSVALGLKRAEPKASLGLMFLMVQLADILFFVLLPLGVERASIVPNITQSSHFFLDSAPISHGLVGSLIYSALVFALFRTLPAREGVNKNVLALAMGVASFSHYVLDVIVHPPDMALLDGGLPHIGLGLWNSWVATYIVEAALLLVGLWLYFGVTRPRSFVGRVAMPIFMLLMLVYNYFNLTGPPPDPASSMADLAVFGLVG